MEILFACDKIHHHEIDILISFVKNHQNNYYN